MIDLQPTINLTSETGVAMALPLAGVPARVFAGLIDLLISMALIGLFFLIIAIASQIFPDGAIPSVLTPFVFPAALLGYPLLFEWLAQGKTVGKSILKIRAIQRTGRPVGFWQAFARAVFRLIDLLFGGFGLLIMLVSMQEQRVGDIVAGTVVIRERAWPSKEFE